MAGFSRIPDRFIWIGLHEPDEDLLRDVQREFGLHDLAIEDAHRAHQRPKLERYGDALFVVLRTAQRDREHHRIVFGGMNFKFMPELEKPWGYPLVLAGTALNLHAPVCPLQAHRVALTRKD